MFAKIRAQLAALNVAVVFLILLVAGTTLYLYMEHNLNSEIDQSLIEMAEPFHLMRVGDRMIVHPIGAGDLNHKRPLRRFVDTPIVSLQWDRSANIVAQMPQELFTEDDLTVFRERLSAPEPLTLTIEGHEYRVLNVKVELPPQARRENMAADVSQIQLIRNIDAEQEILDNLLLVISIGTVLALVVTVVAGFFLAGRAMNPIRRSWEQQQQFVADASHELRTPLAVIRSHTELMLRHPDSTVEEQSQHLSSIYSESTRMSKLVQHLLTLAKQDSGVQQIVRAPVDLAPLLTELGEEFHLIAEVAGIELNTEMEAPLAVQVDAERIRQLLVILLDNAIKYTPAPGIVRMTCKLQHGQLELVVTDTGIGIPAAEVPQIFDRFFRGDKVRSREQGGTGLGLSIAKWIVDAHGGRIRVDSREGAGTTMRVSLPLA